MAGCACDGTRETNLIYACSGAANTGLLADQVMRALNRDGVGSSSCLAGMGAGLSGFLESARGATRNIVLDGCKVACGARIFEKNGIAFQHYVMTDYGVEKGKTLISEDLIEAVAGRVEGLVKA
ncbi:MAG: putative zinc-binding protein [Spirochaetes bacterium]|nr:putative zinc-binding protein [Spirochaetota bacterium]MBU1080812.1 putative zinc-binding protein [Spirochaetota bacterium]